MSLVERIKGFFKPRLTFEQFAVAITSDVRIAIIEELGLMHERRKGYSKKGYDFKAIKYGVFDRLGREVSGESLTWHLEKLKDSDLIEETAGLDHNLTSSGRKVFKVIEKVDRDMEAEVGV